MMNDVANQHTLLKRFEAVRKKIAQAAYRVGRNPEDIALLPVSKTFPPAVIVDAIALGERRFGENKAQELRDKAKDLHEFPAEWVMIGYLQSNNARYIARYATEIQSLDRFSLAQALERRLVLEDRYLDVLVQIKTSTEPSKYGLAAENAAEFLVQLKDQCPRLRVKGLMTMAVNSEDKEEVRSCFRQLKNLQQQLIALNLDGISLERLSMGMSGDFEIAIEEGATEIRIGTAIFGDREYQRDYYWPEDKY